jgi:hypothetical protein
MTLIPVRKAPYPIPKKRAPDLARNDSDSAPIAVDIFRLTYANPEAWHVCVCVCVCVCEREREREREREYACKS